MLIVRWPRGSPTKSRSHVMENNNETLITLTADIVSAHVRNNTVAVNDLPTLIQNVHGALAGAGAAKKPVDEKTPPAVSVRYYVKPAYIVGLTDGQKMNMLKRQWMKIYNMTPDQDCATRVINK